MAAPAGADATARLAEGEGWLLRPGPGRRRSRLSNTPASGRRGCTTPTPPATPHVEDVDCQDEDDDDGAAGAVG